MSKLDLTDLSESSALFGSCKLDLVAGAGHGPNIPCRSCLVKPAKANTQDVFIRATVALSGDEYPLPPTDLPIPVTNLNKLYFSSSQLDATIHILWRL